MINAIIIEENFWANTHLSIVRYTGSVKIGRHSWTLVNKNGISIFDLSNPESEHYVGDGAKAIEPGEPADLVRNDWLHVYEALGREKTIEIVKQGISLEDAEKLIKKNGNKKTTV